MIFFFARSFARILQIKIYELWHQQHHDEFTIQFSLLFLRMTCEIREFTWMFHARSDLLLEWGAFIYCFWFVVKANTFLSSTRCSLWIAVLFGKKPVAVLPVVVTTAVPQSFWAGGGTENCRGDSNLTICFRSNFQLNYNSRIWNNSSGQRQRDNETGNVQFWL